MFDLILIIGCCGCRFMLKIYGRLSASWNNLSNLSQMWKTMWGTWGGYQTKLYEMSLSKWTTRLFSSFLPFLFLVGPVICLFFQIDIIIFSKKKNWYYHIVLCNWNLFLSFWIFALPLCLYNIQYYLKTQRKNAPYCIRRPYVPKWRASSLILIQKSSIFRPWNSWDFYLGSIAAIA